MDETWTKFEDKMSEFPSFDNVYQKAQEEKKEADIEELDINIIS